LREGSLSAGLRIVPLLPEHVEQFRAALGSVAREERYLAMLEAPPLEDMRKFVAESVARQRPRFIAFAGEEPVGWCDVVEKPRESLKHSGVLGMGVVRAHRGRGVGSALMERTLADARAKSFTRIELTVRVDNERARKLYEKFGFAVEGLCRRYMRVRGEYYDSYLMALFYD
jgi:RimJ/RimL family protein N-acetyltransferase